MMSKKLLAIKLMVLGLDNPSKKTEENTKRGASITTAYLVKFLIPRVSNE
jgi:hypothetical protein